MNSNPTSGQISRSTPGHVEPEHVAPDGLSAEMSNLRRDVASLRPAQSRRRDASRLRASGHEQLRKTNVGSETRR